jgi:hypothetical protein
MNSAVCRSTAPRFSATAGASLAYSEDGSGLTAVLFQRQLSAFESEVLAVGFGSRPGFRRSDRNALNLPFTAVRYTADDCVITVSRPEGGNPE